MKTYSMVFLDIDGTLLDSQNQVSENTQKLLKRLEKKNIPIVLCSARSPSGVKQISKLINIRGPYVCYGGSLILDADDSILGECGIPLTNAIAIKKRISEQFPNVRVSTYLYDVWLTDEMESEEIRNEMAITECIPLVSPLEAAASGIDHVHKLLCIGSVSDIAQLRQYGARNFPEVEFVLSKPTYLEIVPRGIDKGSALDIVCRHYHVAPSESIACGDSFTDIPMLENAGLGIAMGNAAELVKRSANRVTASNDEEGVYIALKNLHFQWKESI